MKKTAKKAAKKKAVAPSEWRRETLERMRALIQEAAPNQIEQWKWKKRSNPAGVPAWSHNGIICTAETYKEKVKLTFARGASLADPAGLFNAADTGATRRAIDSREGDKLNEKALKALIKAAVAANSAEAPAKKVAKKATRA